MNVRVDLNEPKIMGKVTNDRFGKFVAMAWKGYIDPYTPRDTGTMEDNVRITPFQIHYYTAGYPWAVYHMTNAKFQKKNPYSTHHWDIAAEQAGQKDKLYRTLNNALKNGQY